MKVDMKDVWINYERKSGAVLTKQLDKSLTMVRENSRQNKLIV